MKKKIFVIVLSTLLTTITVNPTNTYITKTASAAPPNIQPYANKTGYKYKTIYGKLYKRLWSYKYNRWEEPNGKQA